MIGVELGSLRRTHYIKELGSAAGSRATVMGWVLGVRGHGNIAFMTLRDRTGDLQIVAKSGGCPDDIREKISALKPHSSVAVGGTIQQSTKAPGGIEMIPQELRVFSEVHAVAPFEPQAKTVKNIETRLEIRAIDLRRSTLQHVFNARSRVLHAVREYLYGEEFTEISTPKMISTATEGGAALFSIFYYARQAFLAQSPQLYKEQLVMSFEKVFEIAPIFRAEQSRTNRHLSEAISIDLEEAFVDYTDIMNRTRTVIRAAAGAARQYAAENPESDITVPDATRDIPEYTYDELVKRMQDAGAKTQWGDDLYPSGLKKIGLEGFYFIKDWPIGPKPFYVKESRENPRISESFDLMFGDLEISSGSTRIEKRDELEERMRKKGMDTDKFGHHFGVFEYGVPPHAGCGIGLERLMMALLGVENIRDVTFYPRDPDRLVP